MGLVHFVDFRVESHDKYVALNTGLPLSVLYSYEEKQNAAYE
jgi:hypothetical protein